MNVAFLKLFLSIVYLAQDLQTHLDKCFHYNAIACNKFSGISMNGLKLFCTHLKGRGLKNSVLHLPCHKFSTTSLKSGKIREFDLHSGEIRGKEKFSKRYRKIREDLRIIAFFIRYTFQLSVIVANLYSISFYEVNMKRSSVLL